MYLQLKSLYREQAIEIYYEFLNLIQNNFSEMEEYPWCLDSRICTFYFDERVAKGLLIVSKKLFNLMNDVYKRV